MNSLADKLPFQVKRILIICHVPVRTKSQKQMNYGIVLKIAV